jgi:hypothetical protein
LLHALMESSHGKGCSFEQFQRGMVWAGCRAHGLAMQAKVGAMRLHPRQTAWQQFSKAILQQAMPDQGILALLHVSGPILASVRLLHVV